MIFDKIILAGKEGGWVLDRIEVLQQTTESVKTKQEQMNGSVAAHFELEELSRRQ
jgi:hypothetical protein